MTEQGRYTVKVSDDAERALEKLPKKHVDRIIKKLETLESTPRPRGCEKLDSNDYRVRVGSYRIIYSVEDAILVVLVIDIGPRKDIYRRYNRKR
jgi:mRNA interferase RelE/StbE